MISFDGEDQVINSLVLRWNRRRSVADLKPDDRRAECPHTMYMRLWISLCADGAQMRMNILPSRTCITTHRSDAGFSRQISRACVRSFGNVK